MESFLFDLRSTASVSIVDEIAVAGLSDVSAVYSTSSVFDSLLVCSRFFKVVRHLPFLNADIYRLSY